MSLLLSSLHVTIEALVCSSGTPVAGSSDLPSPSLQDAAWREQQRRLLSAHFGPREVESLAMNAVLPLDQDNGCVAGAPLLWVQQREMKVCRMSPHTSACSREHCGPASSS